VRMEVPMMAEDSKLALYTRENRSELRQ
jgi:hypothetical protein